ncbi:MAG: hypothetical protein OHK0012_03990 [Synechococcales cyanobacterium]
MKQSWIGLAVVLGLMGSVTAAASPAVWAQSVRTRGEAATFRVGNRSPHPVRVVLLQRQGGSEPAHWDFAPGEGGSEGLLLSLGEEPLILRPGDVVVSFALDGSRRYWGPNVVGESVAPFWDPVRRIWSMVLQP